MSGKAIWETIRDAQEHKAAMYLVWAQFATDADSYTKALRAAYDASGLRFRLSFEDFRSSIEQFWKEEARAHPAEGCEER